jgi:hypothetical protein
MQPLGPAYGVYRLLHASYIVAPGCGLTGSCDIANRQEMLYNWFNRSGEFSIEDLRTLA